MWSVHLDVEIVGWVIDIVNFQKPSKLNYHCFQLDFWLGDQQ